MATVDGLINQLKKDATIEDIFIVPIKEILSELKVVRKKKDRLEHLEITLIVPLDLAKNISEFYNTKWGLGLLGVKYKK